MSLRRRAGLGASVLVVAAATALPAAAGSISGVSHGLSWTAANDIIGQTSTATQAPPTPPGTVGNPIYWAHSPAPGFDNSKYSGVVELTLDRGAAGAFVCTGSLLSDRIHVLTAGHCVSSGNGVLVNKSTKAYFYGGTDPEAFFYPTHDAMGNVVPPSPGVVGIDVKAESVNPLYTGEVIDEHDIAVVTLAQKAPAFATGYRLFTTGGDLDGLDYNTAGLGRRSDQGGSVGSNLGAGRLRQGDNRYDYALGDPVFRGFFDGGPNGIFGTAPTNHSYIADFDDGSPAQDASCRLATYFGAPPSSKFCDLGRGATEVSTAGGDSGGPQFVNGQIASVTSYGLSFGSDFGDIDDALNDTFGEYNGFVSTRYNSGYINSIAGIPEPASWAMLVAGFGLVGTVVRRRRTMVAA